MKSQNGTVVNQKRISKTVLQNDDRIEIGGAEFVFKEGSKSKIDNLVHELSNKIASQDTVKLSLKDIQHSLDGFSGSLTSLTLAELVQTLNQSLKTGVLVIKGSTGTYKKAQLYFDDGEIVHSELDDLSGPECVILILQLEGGYFEFRNDVLAPQKSINKPTIGILLEAHRLRDESQVKDASNSSVPD